MKIMLPPLALHSSTLNLGPLKESDIPFLVKMHSDPTTMAFAWVEELKTPNQIRNFILEQQLQYETGIGIWAIRSAINGTFIGLCGLRMRKDFYNSIDISFRILPSKRRKGHATKAVGLCIKYGLEVLKLKEVVAQVHHLNVPSRKILSQLGFLENPLEKQGPWLFYKINGRI